jgi:predicted secreted protein
MILPVLCDPGIIHEDTTLPASRHCAVAYDIEAIVAPSNVETVDRLVAIIGVYRRGFEGADRRFIAVPFKWSED